MSRYRTQGLLAVGLGLAAVACGEPELNTNLRPEGPPDVLAVLTQNPIDLIESAVYCKYVGGVRDPKGPGFVGDPLTGGSIVCPETEAEFTATRLEARVDGAGWGLRVMFDELLDPDRVETLECTDVPDVGQICTGSLADTQPFTLSCGAMNTVVPYSGFYVPNGNNTTFPLGPSLYLTPDADALTFPTGSTCTLDLEDVIVDKEGVAVAEADRSFDIKIADLELLFVDPADGDNTVISPDPVAAGAAAFVFNANLASDEDGAALNPDMFELKDGTGAVIPSLTFVGGYNSASDAIYVFPDTATGIFLPGDYVATMKPGEIEEVNGGTLTVTEAVVTRFSVAFGKTGQTTGTDLSAIAPIRISFNNSIDPASVGPEDIELFQTSPTTTPPNQPIPFTLTVGNSTSPALANAPNNAIIITPTMELALGTYVVRIKAGAEIKDTAATPHVAKFAAPVAITYNVLLKVTRTIPSAPPPPAPQTAVLLSTADFDIIFSGSLKIDSVSAAEFDLIDLTTMMSVPFMMSVATSVSRPAPALPSHENDTVRINPANLMVGRMYKVTLKPGTSLTSANGVTRAFPTATNWTFTAI